jgi:8-oxo-dGTP pyrophosphatase MutT (NUDIX family)
MVLRDDPAGPSVLFIERAKRQGDPWSGHMAFPGGRMDRDDADARAAAERETREEVGLVLAGAEPIGRLDDRQGNPATNPSLLISAFVYALPAAPELILNREVEQAFWFPVRALLEPGRHVPYTARTPVAYPGILVGEPDRHIVWGLTYSFLEAFFAAVGRPLPDRWPNELRRGRAAQETRPDQDAERSNA